MAATAEKKTVVTDGKQAELTPAEQWRLEAVRDEVNALVKQAGRHYDDIANKLFKALFGSDVRAALDPATGATPAFTAMQAMAGESLLIDRSLLSRIVRVGALNAHFKVGPWLRLGWSLKVELLPLLGTSLDLERVARGAAFAVKPKSNVRGVRAWVAEQLPAEDKQAGRPEALSVAATRKFLEVARRLKLVGNRRLVADRLRKLDKAAFGAAVADVEVAIKSLTMLREELVSE